MTTLSLLIVKYSDFYVLGEPLPTCLPLLLVLNLQGVYGT